MTYYKKLVLILFSLFITLGVGFPSAQAAVKLHYEHAAYFLSSEIVFFRDNMGAPAPMQAYNHFHQHNDLKPAQAKRIKAGYRPGTYWFKFTLHNKTDQEDWILSLGNHFNGLTPLFHHLSIYRWNESKPIVNIESSDINNESMGGSGILLKVPSYQETTYLMRIDKMGGVPLVISPKVSGLTAYIHSVNNSRTYFFILFAATAVLVAVAFTMLIISRLPSLMLFCLYLPLLILFLAVKEGFIFWLVSNVSLAANEALYILSLFAALAIAPILTRVYLDINKSHHSLNKLLILSSVAVGGFGLFMVNSSNFPSWAYLLYEWLPIYIFCLCAISGVVVSFSRNITHAYWFSWIILLMGMRITQIAEDTLHTTPVLDFNPLIIAITIHIALIGYALLRKIRTVMKSRTEADKIRKQYEKRQREELELRKKLEQKYELDVKNQEKEYLQELRRRDAERQQELIAAKQEAERANEAKSSFLAMISHEIRTPLTGIMGMVQLTSETALDKQQREYIDTVQYSGETLLALLNDILDFSKIEKGKMDIENITFNLPKLLQSVVMLMSGRAVDKGVELKLELGQDVPQYIIGDPTRIRQVLLNLISNAIKFTEKGSITLEVNIKEKTDNDFFHIYYGVKDTGIGLSESAQAKLFDEYAQADESVSRKYGGTGLGLSICKKLTQAMGGDIAVESAEGKGSTFWFVLPTQPGQPMTEASQKAEQASIKPLKILAVDDNEINLKVLTGLLSKDKHNIISCQDPAEALEKAKSEDFDIMLIDMQMPHMNGLELTRSIRRIDHPERSKTPIVALTGNTSHDDVKECSKAGMNDFLTKPLSMESLRKSINLAIKGEGRFDKINIIEPENLPPVQTASTGKGTGNDDKASNVTQPTKPPTTPPPFVPEPKKQNEETLPKQKPAPFDKAEPAPVKTTDFASPSPTETKTESTTVVKDFPAELLAEEGPKEEGPKREEKVKEVETETETEAEKKNETNRLKSFSAKAQNTFNKYYKKKDSSAPPVDTDHRQDDKNIDKAQNNTTAPVDNNIVQKIDSLLQKYNLGTIDEHKTKFKTGYKDLVISIKKAVNLKDEDEELDPLDDLDPIPVEKSKEKPQKEQPVALASPHLDEEKTPLQGEKNAPSQKTIEKTADKPPPAAPLSVETEQKPKATDTEDMPKAGLSPDQEITPDTPPTEPAKAPEADLQLSEKPENNNPAEEETPPMDKETEKTNIENAQAPPSSKTDYKAPENILNVPMLQDLKSSLGEDTFTELFDDLWKKSDEIIAALEKALAQKDLKTINERGHELKGMCANFGLSGISEIARLVEEAGMREDIATAQTNIPHLQELIKQSRQDIDKFSKGEYNDAAS